MGKVGSKLNDITNANANVTGYNPEFDYRSKNLRRLKEAFKALKASLAKAMSNMESTPQHLKEVGNGYSGVAAFLNYSAGGGSATRRDSTGIEMTGSTPNVKAAAAGESGAATPVAPPPARVDRELATESLQASKRFCEAMEALSTRVYPKYGPTMLSKVISEVDNMIALNARVMSQGKATADCMSKYVNARKSAAARERTISKKGKDVTADETHTRLVNDRDTKERVYQRELARFDDQYDDMMAETQKFAAESTEVFLDSVVGYYREVVETIDYTDTPARSKTRSRSVPHNGDLMGGESHEPMSNGLGGSPKPSVKTV
ncbi:hypothetical protein ABL78_3480 [Leptomonas seymouri]|uniref:BAR domain-containing protein n=1 Tax=Leptomonas seymouri TaxID=5684 RepID=A0A0N0P6C0_LEPSE|nr:hypothetical protein ABL78_3480 [Leptomonas seymouri]|eukprot:KPI87449.1 hypothetical protein ABL78_3480 [Leptomonas seymouri]